MMSDSSNPSPVDPQGKNSDPRQPSPNSSQQASSPEQTTGQTKDEQMAKLERENKTLLEHLQRERADFMNYRTRMESEKTAWMAGGQNELILTVLPLVEAWERAIAHIPEDWKNDEWSAGILQIQTLIASWLRQHQIEKIPTIGTPFDPAHHDAILQAPGEKDSIISELEAGYKRQERILKPAKVVLGKGEEAEQEQETQDAIGE